MALSETHQTSLLLGDAYGVGVPSASCATTATSDGRQLEALVINQPCEQGPRYTIYRHYGTAIENVRPRWSQSLILSSRIAVHPRSADQRAKRNTAYLFIFKQLAVTDTALHPHDAKIFPKFPDFLRRLNI